MTELVKILEAAQKQYQASNKYFDMVIKYEDKNDKETAQVYWAITQERMGRYRGLLDAYQIMTGTKLYEWEIMDELERIQVTA